MIDPPRLRDDARGSVGEMLSAARADGPRDATADVRDATPTPDANDASDAPVVFDAAPDVVDASYDPTGAACAVANAIETRQCGRCGFEKRLCRAEDGGTPTVFATVN